MNSILSIFLFLFVETFKLFKLSVKPTNNKNPQMFNDGYTYNFIELTKSLCE